MPALTRVFTRGGGMVAFVALLACCHAKATPAQCDAILDRYAELLTTEHAPDASAETIAAEKKREREESRGDDDFRNCTSQVEESDYECAMKAKTAEALEHCLE